MTTPHIDGLGRTSDWSGVHVVVAGFGVSGYAAADNLLFLGARVTALVASSSAVTRAPRNSRLSAAA